jgi:acetyl-CoA carboxylase, biotin carboxylase subunit
VTINKLLIANRGEIAVRINRAARRLGIKVAQVASTVDLSMLAAKMADEVIDIGGPKASKSYLDTEKVMAAAKSVGADAIHPGYGFLSESPKFASAVESAGLTYVDPSAETIAQMGDKAEARKAAEKCGVKTVPGSDGRLF